MAIDIPVNYNGINPYGGYQPQNTNVNSSFQPKVNRNVQQKTEEFTPKAGIAYSAEDYELADKLASISLFAPEQIKSQPAGHQGKIDNPFSEAVTAWSKNGGAPVNNGDGFYNGQQASIFDEIA